MKSKHRRMRNLETDQEAKAVMIQQYQKQIQVIENLLNKEQMRLGSRVK